MVFGLIYAIPQAPVDAFCELAPVFIVIPGTGFGIEVGIGARVYP